MRKDSKKDIWVECKGNVRGSDLVQVSGGGRIDAECGLKAGRCGAMLCAEWELKAFRSKQRERKGRVCDFFHGEARWRRAISHQEWSEWIPSLQTFLLEAEDMPPSLPSLAVQESCTFPQCFSKNCCQPQGKNPAAPQRGANHHPHLHFKLNAPTKEVWGKRGSNRTCTLWFRVCVRCSLLEPHCLLFFLFFLFSAEPFRVMKVKVMTNKLKIMRKSIATEKISREIHTFSTVKAQTLASDFFSLCLSNLDDFCRLTNEFDTPGVCHWVKVFWRKDHNRRTASYPWCFSVVTVEKKPTQN